MWSAVEAETQDLTLRAAAILELLAHSPAAEDSHDELVMLEASLLSRFWKIHLETLSSASRFVVSRDRHFASFMVQIEKEAATVMSLLDALTSSKGPERRGASQASLALRVREAAVQVLRLVSREQATVIPLVRRWCSTRPDTAAVSEAGPIRERRYATEY